MADSEQRNAEVVLTAQTQQFTQEIDKGNKSLEKLLTTLDKTSKAWDGLVKKTGKGLIKLGTAELAGYTALSAIAGRLEKQTENISANMAINKSSSQFNMVTDSIREMSRAMPLARSEIALMATAVSDLGFTTGKQISGVTQQFNKMGLATGENSQTLATNMVQFQRSMGVSPTYQTMEPYANSATYLSAKAGAPASSILGFGQSIAPAARVAGLSQASVLGLSTAAVRSGADGAYATSTINQILNDVTALRYTGSPDIRRYSNALGIPLADLTRKTTGPDDQDKFMRDIMSKVVAASQSEEGPTKLGMLGFDGLRAKKALQALASESGGIERWIDEARYGMTSGSVETGFKQATGGMYDQATMLRNRMTDFGQEVGAPLAQAFTTLLTVVNQTASAMQPLLNVVGELAKYMAPLGALVATFGAALKMWSFLASAALLKRLVNNVGTQAVGRTGRELGTQFGTGQIIGRAAAKGEQGATWSQFRAAAPAGGPGPMAAFQRAAYYMGGAYGGVLPNLRPEPGGPNALQRGWQGMLHRTDQALMFLSREAKFNYAQAGRTPDDRVAAAAERRAEGTDRYQRRGGRVGPYTVGEVAGTGARGLLTVPMHGLGWGAREVGRLGWRAAPMAADSMANAAVGATMGAGRMAAGGIAAGLGAIGIHPAVAAALLFGGIGAKAFSENKQWDSRWKEGGKGFDGLSLDNLSKYNEQLGIATRSLVRFSHELDKTNPAKTEDVNAEILNSRNVEDVGRASGYEMTDEQLKKYKTPESAKAWLSAQGDLGADQAVLVFRDFAKVLNSKDYKDVQQWYTSNQGKVTSVTGTNVDGLTGSFQTQVNKSLGWNDYALSMFGDAMVPGLAEKNAQSAADLVGSIASKATAYGEKVDATGAVKGESSPEQAQQVISFAADVGMKVEQMKKLLDAQAGADTWWTENRAKAAYESFVAESGNQLGQLDLSALTTGDVYGKSKEERDQKINEIIFQQLTEKQGEDPTGKLLLQSGLITPNGQFGGVGTENFMKTLPQLIVNTTADTILNNSKFANISDENRKQFASGTLLGTSTTTGLYDQMDQMAAANNLLEIATEEFSSTSEDSATNIKKIDSALRSLLGGLSDTHPFWATVKGAQEMLATRGSYMQFGTVAQRTEFSAGIDQNLIADASVTGVNRNPEAGAALRTRKDEIIQQKKDEYAQLRELDRDRFREAEDWNQQREYSDWSFNRSRKFAQDDFQRQTQRSRDAYQRQFANSEAAFQRSLKYSEQDFYRSRKREAEAHTRQMRYVAEDMAKSIGDPYNRIQLQLLNDPNAMISNMENKLSLVAGQNRNVSALKERGLSNEAVQQLDLTNFTNAQQTQHLANTMTDADIAEFNRIAKAMVSQSGQLNKSDPNTIRSEKERKIGLDQSMEDFLRQLSRTKIEHSVQVKFSKKEFEIGIKQAGEELSISLKRAKEEYDKGMAEAEKTRQKSFDRAIENIYGIYKSNVTSEEEMAVESMRLLGKYGGKHTDLLLGAYKKVEATLARIKRSIAELDSNAPTISNPGASGWVAGNSPSSEANSSSGGGRPRGRGASVRAAGQDKTNTPGMCLYEVSRWLAPGGIRGAENATDAWNKSKKKHVRDTNPPPGYPVYWAGGDGHVALSIGGGWVRSTDWPRKGRVGSAKISDITKSWGKTYNGWAEDAWGHKLAAGGVAKATPGGVKATIAEAGSNELVMPLDKRGLSFMKDFQVTLAHELVRTMPKTSTSGGVVNNITNRNQNIDIKTVEVKTNDPKEFARHLRDEAQKKRAALYKS
jgi:TP901 family phage tail tape measure protein